MHFAGSLLSAAVLLSAPADAATSPRVEAVRRYADLVLEKGRDRYHGTPLFVDGLNVDTLEPVVWVYKGQEWVPSDLASHQNLFRTLVGLSRLTGDARYRQAAADAFTYHFEHLRSPCGLLKWGGHRFIDLRTMNVVGEQNSHEFKCSYPFYDLMWEVDHEATRRFLTAFWNAHVLDWSTLDMNRHGIYEKPMGELWASGFEEGPPFFEGRGLTFINAGSDLIYAAGTLYRLTGDKGALLWARRLAERYVQARDPKTKLGAYQYSQLADGKDRAKVQFGPEFGALALEGKMLDPSRADTIYGKAALSQMRLAESLGDDGKQFLEWTREGLLAFAKYAYNPETNTVKAMFTDGTPIRAEDVKRTGYYSAGAFAERPAGPNLLLSYAAAWRLTRDPALWQTVRAMARGAGLGDLGTAPGQGVRVEKAPATAEPVALLALLEICRAAPEPAYRDLAVALGDKIIKERVFKGIFLPDAEHVNATFDALEPLALLSLEALLRGTPDAVPAYIGGRGYIHGPHEGLGRTYDANAIWGKKR